MKIIPFDIKLRPQVQSEENHYQGRYKVQTKSGNTVRIVCWDKKDFTFPIVALVEDSLPGSEETTLSFCQDGMYYPRGIESNNDLCLLDTWEPKFKVGDNVRYKNSNRVYRIADILECHYLALQPDQSSRLIPFEDDDLLEWVPEEHKEPELTDFEKELANCLYKYSGVVCMDGMKTLAKEFAPRLLEIAKNKIIEKLKEE